MNTDAPNAHETESVRPLTSHFIDAVMEHFSEQSSDIKATVTKALQLAVERMDLVTKEELQLQKKLLSNAEDQLKQLHERLSKLENS